MRIQRVSCLLVCAAALLGGLTCAWAAAEDGAAWASPEGHAAPLSAHTPPALMLAQSWSWALSPADFLVSEKLDGVRAFWDGRVLRFRSGRPIAAPAWFTAALPNFALDGELWLGRGRFDQLSGTVRRTVPVDADWQKLHYMLFDLPGQPGTFEERVARLSQIVRESHISWLHMVAQERGSSKAALQRRLQSVVREGGEGLMLHRADALWQSGRSAALRKLKVQPDEEAQVVAWVPGQGRLRGVMGGLLLERPNGQRFVLGSGFSDAVRANPPAIGAWVTYRYRGRTPQGLPRFASFWRVRVPE